MHSIRFCLLAVAITVTASAAVTAQTSYPMLTHTTPVAVQRGKTTEVTVHAQMNLYGAYKALFEGAGIKAEVVTKPAKKNGSTVPRVSSIKLKLTVAPDAALGMREFRLASVLGISSVGQIVIVDAPVVEEASANNTRAQAQNLHLPCVAAGRLEAKVDVDFFKFEAKEGDWLTFEVYCARLQDKIHDLQNHAKPMLVLYEADGRELASNDHFYFADPMLSYQVPRSGTYYLQIRDSTYDGDPRWVYALLATDRPYASHVYPMAGNPNRKIMVEPVGSAARKAKQVALTAPGTPGVHRIALDLGGERTNPVTFLVSDLPQVLETEPNDTPAQATRVSIPCGINGRIGRDRDLDHFVFAGNKGKTIEFTVQARQFGTLLQSTVHAVLEVMTREGKVLARSTQTHSRKETALVFTPPADSDYVLRVRDLNSKGGAAAIYYIEARPAQPDFTLTCDPDKAMIGPGSSTAWFVKVERHNGFQGPVRVQVVGLPPGVHCSALTIPQSMTQGVLVLTADGMARPGATNVKVVGEATVKDVRGQQTTLRHEAVALEEIYSPGGGRAVFPVRLQTVAVTEPSDVLKVTVTPTKIVLKPGQDARIDVEIQRHPDYKKDVSLDLLLQHLGSIYGNPLPPGVTVVEGKSKTLLGTGNKGHIVLKAAPSAGPVEEVPIAVLAHVSINFVVKVSYASAPILVSVRK